MKIEGDISPDTSGDLHHIAHEYAEAPYAHLPVSVAGFALAHLGEVPRGATTLITGDEVLQVSVRDRRGRELLYTDVILTDDSASTAIFPMKKDGEGKTIPPKSRKLTEDEGRGLVADIQASMEELKKRK